jgi:hypothetical protein
VLALPAIPGNMEAGLNFPKPLKSLLSILRCTPGWIGPVTLCYTSPRPPCALPWGPMVPTMTEDQILELEPRATLPPP